MNQIDDVLQHFSL